MTKKVLFVAILLSRTVMTVSDDQAESDAAVDSAESHQILTDRFLKEYPGAVAKLQSQFENVQITLRLSNDVFGRGPSERRIFVNGNDKGDVVRHLADQPLGGIFGRVHIQKDDQVCVLIKRGANSGYQILMHSPATKEAVEKAISSNIDSYLFACFTVGGVPVSHLIRDRSNITSIKQVRDQNDHELIEVDFVTNDPEIPLKQGRLLFDAERDWIMVSCENCEFSGNSATPIYLHQKCTFTKIEGGPWVPQEFLGTQEWSVDGQKYSDVIGDAVLESASIGTVNDNQFLLSTYGLGEIASPVKHGNRFVLIGIFNALAVLAIFLTWRFLRNPKKSKENLS